MTELEAFVSEQIKTLVPNYEAVELTATVGSSSLSIEFFATVDEKKMQCFEMIDERMFSEKSFNTVSKAIADYLRKLPNYNAEGINKYAVVLRQ